MSGYPGPRQTRQGEQTYQREQTRQGEHTYQREQTPQGEHTYQREQTQQTQQTRQTQQTQPVRTGVGNVRLDVVETTDDMLILAEIPGFDEDDILIEGLNQQVRITAEREGEHERDAFHLRERSLKVERMVSLPMAVEMEHASAEFDDGVCRIAFPKAKRAQSHRIGID